MSIEEMENDSDLFCKNLSFDTYHIHLAIKFGVPFLEWLQLTKSVFL